MTEKRRYGMTEEYSSSHAFERSEIKASNYRDPLTFCYAKRGVTEGVYGLLRRDAPRNDKEKRLPAMTMKGARNDGWRGGVAK